MDTTQPGAIALDHVRRVTALARERDLLTRAADYFARMASPVLTPGICDEARAVYAAAALELEGVGA